MKKSFFLCLSLTGAISVVGGVKVMSSYRVSDKTSVVTLLSGNVESLASCEWKQNGKRYRCVGIGTCSVLLSGGTITCNGKRVVCDD